MARVCLGSGCLLGFVKGGDETVLVGSEDERSESAGKGFDTTACVFEAGVEDDFHNGGCFKIV